MTEQGKVTQFEVEVITLEGKHAKQLITRVGSFNLVSEGQYLSYQGDPPQVVELASQPKRHFTRHIKKVEKAKEGTQPIFALDPTRGSLISILIRTPSIFERIQQGGLVGFVIIIVLLLGLLIVFERWVVIRRETKKIDAQLKTSVPKEDNPVGQILSVL